MKVGFDTEGDGGEDGQEPAKKLKKDRVGLLSDFDKEIEANREKKEGSKEVETYTEGPSEDNDGSRKPERKVKKKVTMKDPKDTSNEDEEQGERARKRDKDLDDDGEEEGTKAEDKLDEIDEELKRMKKLQRLNEKDPRLAMQRATPRMDRSTPKVDPLGRDPIKDKQEREDQEFRVRNPLADPSRRRKLDSTPSAQGLPDPFGARSQGASPDALEPDNYNPALNPPPPLSRKQKAANQFKKLKNPILASKPNEVSEVMDNKPDPKGTDTEYGNKRASIFTNLNPFDKKTETEDGAPPSNPAKTDDKSPETPKDLSPTSTGKDGERDDSSKGTPKTQQESNNSAGPPVGKTSAKKQKQKDKKKTNKAGAKEEEHVEATDSEGSGGISPFEPPLGEVSLYDNRSPGQSSWSLSFDGTLTYILSSFTGFQ